MSRGWDDLRADLLARIRAREWPPGGLIPGEEQLAADYGVARATVNRALQALAEAGMLERKKRAGTRVAVLPVRKARLDIPVIRREVEATGATYGFRVLSDGSEPLPAGIAGRMALPARTPLRHLVTLHLADATPFALEDRWLDPAALPLPPGDFAGLSANEWLVAQVPFVSGTLAFLAAPADAAVAHGLEVPENTALLQTERTTFGPSGAITHVRLWHRPGYRVETTL